MEQGVGTLTVEFDQVTQLLSGLTWSVAILSVEVYVTLFEVTDVAKIRIDVEEHVLDLTERDIAAKLVVVPGSAGIVYVIVVFQDEPSEVFKQIVLPGMDEVDPSSQFLLQPFMTFLIQMSVFVLEFANVAQYLAVDHFDDVERIDDGNSIREVFVDVSDVWAVHVCDQIFHSETFGFWACTHIWQTD
jgi:hypothetical protein